VPVSQSSFARLRNHSPTIATLSATDTTVIALKMYRPIRHTALSYRAASTSRGRTVSF
jgi:hypothetical protein